MTRSRQKTISVAVVVPSMVNVHAEFMMSLLNLVSHFANNQVPGYGAQSIRVINKRGSILPNLRLQGLQEAAASDADFILWLDSDHKFPPDLLFRLLSWKKDVVALNCATKTMPINPTARAFDENDIKGKPVFTRRHSEGLERVWRVGFGVMLMSRRAYMQIPHDAFGMHYIPEVGCYQGEDWNVCAALEKAGCPIYVDHEASMFAMHIGTFDYDHSYTGEWDEL